MHGIRIDETNEETDWGLYDAATGQRDKLAVGGPPTQIQWRLASQAIV